MGLRTVTTGAPTTRETADHAELARIAEQCRLKADKLGCDEWRAPALLKQASRGLEALLSEIAALRGERDRLAEELHNEIVVCAGKSCDADVAERQRDELRKAVVRAMKFVNLCVDAGEVHPEDAENPADLWDALNATLLANQGADQ